MEPNPVKVLLVGENSRAFSFLQERLESRGCECQFAASGAEAARITAKSRYDLVLCLEKIQGMAALIASMRGSSGTLYCSHLLDQGCMWWPAVLNGVNSLGAPGMWPSEFVNVLDKSICEAQSRLTHRVQAAAAASRR